MPRSLSWIAALLGAAILLSFFATIERDPIPNNDETYDATAILDLNQGGAGVPTALPPSPAWTSFTAMYGPVYFRLSQPLVRAFGMRPLATRLWCAIGAVLVALATAWLARALGASLEWSLFAFFVMAACPDLAMISANARVDSLSIAFQLAGLAMIAAAMRAKGGGAAAAAGAAAGVAWGAALTTSGRVLPFFAMLGLAGLAVPWMPRAPRRHLLAAGALALAVSALIYSGWTLSLGSNPAAHLVAIRASIDGDWFNHVTAGQRRTWGLTLRPALAAGAIFVMTALVLAARPEKTAEGIFGAMLAWAGVGAAIYWIVDANNVFFVSARSFTLQMLAAALAATPLVREAAARARLRAAWAGVAALFLVVASGKMLELGVNWEARSPAALESFVAANVPPGSLVLGPDRYYVYAVESAGARYRATNVQPFRTAAGWGGMAPAHAYEGAAGQPRFLLWADGEALDDRLQCARPFRAASFTPAAPDGRIRSLLARVIGRRGYPASTLYRVPAGCGTLAADYPFGSESAK